MSRLSLALLGVFEATLDGCPITTFESAKVRALLAYLAVEARQAHSRAALAELLWPDLPGAKARADLRHVLVMLREAIGDRSRVPPLLLVTRDTIQLNPAGDYDLDVATFTALLDTCETHAHRRSATCTACARRRERAVALYRDDFLASFFLSDSAAFEEWAVFTREPLRQRMLEALRRLVGYYLQQAAYSDAQRCAARQVELDPLDEAGHRHLMLALWQSGQRDPALAHYLQCCRILAQELGVEPEPETTALGTRIRDGAEEQQAARRLPLSGRHVHNLPAQTTPFIGREAEVAHLADLLEQTTCRLVTIVGPGGIGKTRLALEAAPGQAATFADGVWFVPLASLGSAGLLAPALVAALELRLDGPDDPKDRLRHWLRDKELLLLLDNFEHLLGGTGLVGEILAHAPGVSLLVTSRARLQLHGESVIELSGLRYPAADEQVTERGAYSAVDLFVQSARQARADFALSPEEAAGTASICRLVEGMPLAIELASAWTRLLSTRDIACEIEGSLDFLGGSLVNVPARHRSMRAVLDHSWSLLSAEEQRVLRTLAVFRGDFEREAAEEVAGASLRVLAGLADTSLLRRSTNDRYALHELVRQYAEDRLGQAAEVEAARRGHARYYVKLVQALERLAQEGPDQAASLDRLEGEHDNLRAALAWSQCSPAGTEPGLRLAGMLGVFWQFRGHSREGLRWLEQVLQAADADRPAYAGPRAKALLEAAWHHYYQGALPRAGARFAECLALYRTLGDMEGTAHTLFGMAYCAVAQGDYPRAMSLAEESLLVARRHQYRFGTYHALQIAGQVDYALGNYARATQRLREALVLAQADGNAHVTAGLFINMGCVAYAQGDDARALAFYTESLERLRALAYPGMIAELLLHIGRVAHRQGNAAQAGARYRESLTWGRERGNRLVVGDAVAALAGIAATAAQPRRAARLFGVAQALRDATGACVPPYCRADYDRDVAAARAQLDEHAWAIAWAEGHAMSLEQGAEYALEDVSLPDSAAAPTWGILPDVPPAEPHM